MLLLDILREDNISARVKKILAKKIKLCLQENITPIYCVGETLEQRNANEQFEIVKNKSLELYMIYLQNKLKKLS